MGSVSGLPISTALAAPSFLAHQIVQNLCKRGGNGVCLPNGARQGAKQLLPAHACNPAVRGQIACFAWEFCVKCPMQYHRA